MWGGAKVLTAEDYPNTLTRWTEPFLTIINHDLVSSSDILKVLKSSWGGNWKKVHFVNEKRKGNSNY